MNLRTFLLLFLALGLAALTTVLARHWIAAERASMVSTVPEPAPPPPSPRVLVAVTTLSRGSFVRAEHLHWQAWPAQGIAETFVREGTRQVQDFAGAVVRTPVIAGQPVTAQNVVFPGERGFLAAVLTPGMRAISVPVNATSGISGFVFPGDEVDLVLSIKMNDKGGTGSARVRYASETVIRGVRVLAVDQRIEKKDGEAVVAKTATLEVTPRQAEKVAMALEMGALSLSLHSLAEPAPEANVETMRATTTRAYTRDLDVTAVRDSLAAGDGESGRQVQVLRGTKAEVAKF